jgi:hypothetical protein
MRMTIPRSSALFVSCAPGSFLGGSQGGRFLLFLADFGIFSSLPKIILVLGIRVLVSMEYLKTLYILYSEW